jgi:hypothetical protein
LRAFYLIFMQALLAPQESQVPHSSIAKSLLFALIFSASVKLTASTDASQKAIRGITVSQTGTDPEPITPTGSGGTSGY